MNVDNLIEEIETMGASVWCALDSRLTMLLTHLLKWQYQPEYKGKSWRLTIEEQRYQIARFLRKNTSLKPAIGETLHEAYFSTVRFAAKESELEVSDFPSESPRSAERVLDTEFYPD